jgi:hypothetical protein
MKYTQYIQTVALVLIVIGSLSFITQTVVNPNRLVAAISGTGSGLIAYYPFDDGTGSDQSGNGKNATLSGGVTAVPGIVGSQALSFDGSTGKATMNIASTNTFTVSMWINPTSQPTTYGTLLTQGVTKGLYIKSDRSLSYFEGGDRTTRTPLTNGVWQHVVVVSNGTSLTFYLNGVQDKTPISYNVGTVTFNSMGNDSGNEKYKGLIDDARVYNRALSASEVSQLYALGGGSTAINGSCSTNTVNICLAGTFADQTDTSSNYLWQCTGINSGATASCSLPIPAVNGQCGASTNQCVAGNFSDQTDTSSQNLWQCSGTNGGTTASCSTPIATVAAPAPSVAAEITRFNKTQSTVVNSSTVGTQTTVTLTNSINSGTTAVILLGFEGDSNVGVSSVTDSKGNTWKIQKTYLNNSVHQGAVISAFMTQALSTLDTIKINWTTFPDVDYAGVVMDVAGGDSSNNSNVAISDAGYDTNISLPGQITVPNAIVLGLVQAQQPITYSNSNWNQVGSADNFAQSQFTVGLSDIYLDGVANAAGTYNPGGQWNITQTYLGLWVAFAPNGSTVGGGNPPPPPPPVNGVCSTTALNTCTSGTFVDQADNASASLWQCAGANGGTSMQCSVGMMCSQ